MKKYLVISKSYTGPRKSIEVEAKTKAEAKSKALEYSFINEIHSITLIGGNIK